MKTTKTVLFVDDDSDLRGALATQLRRHFAVVELSSADSAWEALQNGLRVDAVLTDLHMPGISSSGYWLVGQIKQDAALAGLPIILMSADSYVRDIAHATGAAAHIQLPASAADIIATVRRVLRL
jgi:chemotaxis family two-component system sensor histidine kinase/response regulator PixL